MKPKLAGAGLAAGVKSLLATLAVAVTAQPSAPADPDRLTGGTSY